MLTPKVYVISSTNLVTPEGKVIRKDIMQEVVDTNGDYYCVVYKQLSKWAQEFMGTLQSEFVEYLVEPEAKACTRC